MAKIDLYNARGLAKQAVGTPGMDNSGSYIAHAGGSILDITATYIKAENAKREIADNLLAETERIKWENELYNGFEAAKREQTNLDNPYGLADSVFDKAQASAQSYAKNISNPRAREKFLEKSVSTVRQAQTSMRNWASGQTVTNAFVNVKEGIDAITVQASKMNDPAGFNGVMSQAEALIANATPVIGTENAYRLRDGMRKDIANSFIYSKIDASPTSIEAYIDSGMFNGILDEKEQHSLKNTARIVANRNASQQKAATSIGTNATYQDLMKRSYEGNLTISEINNALSQAQAAGHDSNSAQVKKLMKLKDHTMKFGGSKHSVYDDPDALNRVQDAFKNIEQKGKGKEISFRLQDATLNELQSIQDVLDDNAQYLTKETRNNMQAMLNSAWENHVSDNPYARGINLNQSLPEVFRNGFAADEYNAGLRAGYNFVDKNYPGEYRNRAKVVFSKVFNSNYNRARKDPDYDFNTFMLMVQNKVDDNMRSVMQEED